MSDQAPENNRINEDNKSAQVVETAERQSFFSELKSSEDWWAVWLGILILAGAFLSVYCTLPVDFKDQVVTAEKNDKKVKLTSPLKKWLGKPGIWTGSPMDAFYLSQDRADVLNKELAEASGQDLSKDSAPKKVFKPHNKYQGLIGIFIISILFFGMGVKVQGKSFTQFSIAFVSLFLLAILAYILAGQLVIKHYNLEYALWALLVGLIISNTIGTPKFLKPAILTEFYIKTGLVLLGAGVLFSKLLVLGVPGIFVAWVVTPIVLVSTYIFGQKVLKIESASLNMVISADMSVCGVSAAIATAASCKAKKEELSLAIGLSLGFTVVMMVVLPAVIKAMGLSPILGGAWLGGTIDATGAVAAAGEFLGDQALEVATTIKMIQNILIGVTAFLVAIYWVTFVEKREDNKKPNAMEIWYRFPKFILGFVTASLVFSYLYTALDGGDVIINTMVKQSTKTIRGWFFCLAFVSIGLDTNFRELAKHLKGGKPLILYVCGQSLNLLLTLFMAWLMFENLFKEEIQKIFP